ncbi:hypothetical protein [Bradyrhizobium sp. USDA 10063]
MKQKENALAARWPMGIHRRWSTKPEDNQPLEALPDRECWQCGEMYFMQWIGLL